MRDENSSYIPLNDIISAQNDRDRRQENGRRVSNDEEGRNDGEKAGDPAAENHGHGHVENVDILAESVEDPTLRRGVEE